jgi:hypothetical protein
LQAGGIARHRSSCGVQLTGNPNSLLVRTMLHRLDGRIDHRSKIHALFLQAELA